MDFVFFVLPVVTLLLRQNDQTPRVSAQHPLCDSVADAVGTLLIGHTGLTTIGVLHAR